MYQQQFGFQDRPFGSIATAAAYFPASSAESALESLRLCVERAAGPALIIGPSGLGKSQLLAVLQEEFRQRFRIVQVLACSRMSRRHDLLQNILFELGQPYRQLSEGELRLALIDFLRPTPQCPHGMLLLVDDAHMLPSRILDELRLIHNFVRDGQPRVRLVLAGTSELEERLTLPQLEPLQQRIAARCYLAPFRRDEIPAYLQHQLRRAGGQPNSVFQPSAIQAIAQLCEGNPRLVNQVCDHALMLANSSGSPLVSGELIAEAYSDIQQIPVSLWSNTTGATTPVAGPEVAPIGGNDVPQPLMQTSSSVRPSMSFVEFGALPAEKEQPKQVQPRAPISAQAPESTAKPAAAPALELRPEPRLTAQISEISRIVASLEHEETLPAAYGSTVDPTAARPITTPKTRNPFDEEFASEHTIPNEAKQLRAVLAALTQQAASTPLQRTDRCNDPLVRATHLLPADDRDLIVVTSGESMTSPSMGTADEEATEPPVSRGRARRVEYNLLFQQLRAGKS